jgi:flagellar assembly factor FliW
MTIAPKYVKVNYKSNIQYRIVHLLVLVGFEHVIQFAIHGMNNVKVLNLLLPVVVNLLIKLA